MSSIIDGDLIPVISVHCKKLHEPIRGKRIDLADTGSRDTNALDKLMRCECKTRKVGGIQTVSLMGTWGQSPKICQMRLSE